MLTAFSSFSGHGTPRRIHSSSASISSFARGPTGGIFSRICVRRTACIRRLSSGFPSTTGLAGLSSFEKALTRIEPQPAERAAGVTCVAIDRQKRPNLGLEEFGVIACYGC